ncbi:MAG TPA: peptidylprolyl isomerase [Bryobacteraceae bacterium]|jgi:peptidyl-prolyl cis-trans isomerase SurA|nr:peptidylprolyl isomerase [Bryobacteraceae bacterium]
MKRQHAWLAAAFSCLALTSCSKAPPAGVAAAVNGQPITYAQLDKTYKTQYGQPPENANADLVKSQRLELLGSLITNQIMLQEAYKAGLQAVDADVDAELNKMKTPYTKEEFDKQLAGRNMSIDDLKTEIRQKLTVDKLIAKEITSHITITDADVANFYNANKASFNLAEPQVHLAQIVVTPTPDPNVRNLRNSKAQNDAEAAGKIKDIERRIKERGEDFTMLAQNFSEDPNTAPNGGDMGFIPESTLDKANPELRRMVMSLQPGGISPIIHTQGDYRILKLISKEPAGQRDLNDPRVQENIRENLRNSADQVLRNAYYEVVRNRAKVDNYFAQNIVATAGKK